MGFARIWNYLHQICKMGKEKFVEDVRPTSTDFFDFDNVARGVRGVNSLLTMAWMAFKDFGGEREVGLWWVIGRGVDFERGWDGVEIGGSHGRKMKLRERERERERGLWSFKWFMILCGGVYLVFSKLLWHFLIRGCKTHILSRD